MKFMNLVDLQLDPVHQVDHKDEFSNMISLQKTHPKVDQPGFKKYLFQLFFKMSWGHFEGSDFKPFVILARVLVDFKVVFGRLFSDIWKWPKMVKNGPGAAPPDRHHPPDRPPSPGLSAGVE